VDNLINALFFAAAGIGLRASFLGHAAVALGLLAAGALLLCGWWSELLERLSPPNTRAYSGRWGFDPDDALYLLGPLAWLGWLGPVLVGAALATPVIAAITGLRLLRLRRLPPQAPLDASPAA
jgi:archaetidylinositol phosphate synthase